MNFGRTFRFRENKLSLEIRGEFTNIFNRTQIGNPITTAPGSAQTKNALGQYSAGFGVINLTVAGANIPPSYTQNAVVGQLFATAKWNTHRAHNILRFSFNEPNRRAITGFQKTDAGNINIPKSIFRTA
jgi:hypothetical protein